MNIVLDKAFMFYRQERYPEAIATYLEVLLAEPNNWMVRYYLAMSYLNMRSLQKAQGMFELIIGECKEEGLRKKSEAGLARANMLALLAG